MNPQPLHCDSEVLRDGRPGNQGNPPHPHLFFFFKMYLFLAMLGLRSRAQVFSTAAASGSCSPLRCGLLTVVASLAADCGVTGCGTLGELLCDAWDLPELGIEPASPALAGGFLITRSPRKLPAPLFYNSHPNWHEMVSHCGFDLCYPEKFVFICLFEVTVFLQSRACAVVKTVGSSV